MQTTIKNELSFFDIFNSYVHNHKLLLKILFHKKKKKEKKAYSGKH